MSCFQVVVLQMQGVSEASERPGFFKRIMETNVSGISKAYAAAEALFEQLQVWPVTLPAHPGQVITTHIFA